MLSERNDIIRDSGWCRPFRTPAFCGRCDQTGNLGDLILPERIVV